MIGIEGMTGVGKTTLALNLIRENENMLMLEMSKLHGLIVEKIVNDNIDQDEMISYVEGLLTAISYKVIDKQVEFYFTCGDTCRNKIDIKRLKIKVLYFFPLLGSIINKKLKEIMDIEILNATIVYVGRDISALYSELDYHFTLIADINTRYERLQKRDNYSGIEFYEREKLEKIIARSQDTLEIDTTDLSKEDTLKKANQIIKWGGNYEQENNQS